MQVESWKCGKSKYISKYELGKWKKGEFIDTSEKNNYLDFMSNDYYVDLYQIYMFGNYIIKVIKISIFCQLKSVMSIK